MCACAVLTDCYSTYWILTYTAYRARMHKHDDCLQSAMVSARAYNGVSVGRFRFLEGDTDLQEQALGPLAHRGHEEPAAMDNTLQLPFYTVYRQQTVFCVC